MSARTAARATGPARFLDGIRQGLEQRRRFRNTFNELDRLSDRELNDLGIARGDIGHIAREAVYG